MSVIKTKNKDGKWESIPAIKGEPGVSGVYVGSGDMPEGYNV